MVMAIFIFQCRKNEQINLISTLILTNFYEHFTEILHLLV
jgi:hypothetical protein